MKLALRQKVFNLFGPAYRVYFNDREIYDVESNLRLIGFFSQTVISTIPGTPIIQLSRRLSWPWNARFTIKQRGGKTAEFITKSFWNDHFQCFLEDDQYDIYMHRGLSTSVYKNGKQVAEFEKDKYVVMEMDLYEIRLDNDAFTELICGFVMIINQCRYDNRFSLMRLGIHFGPIQFQLGKLGSGAKRRNKSWEPLHAPDKRQHVQQQEAHKKLAQERRQKREERRRKRKS